MRLLQNKVLFLFLLTGCFFQLNGQVQCDDLELIKDYSIASHEDAGHKHHILFLLSDHPSVFVRYNPASLVLGSIMWTYQKIISPQFASSCLYSPSCSGYSIKLISDYGILKGMVLTADRLTRCNRLALMDYKIWEVNSKDGKIKESTTYYRIND